MSPQFFWMGCIYIIFTVSQVRCASMLLPSYEVSLYSENLKLSTVLYLRPAYCLYEEWLHKAIDTTIAIRKSSTISVQVQIDGDNGTYVLPNAFSIPQCSWLTDPEDIGPIAYQAGPDIDTLNRTRVQRILPGRVYSFRFVLSNAANREIAYTNWSQPFETRDLPQSPSDINASLRARSGGMVVITVLLSIAMFLLLLGLAVVFGSNKGQ